MNTIPKLEDYRLGDLVQFFNNVLKLFSDKQAAQIGIDKQYQAFKTASGKLSAEYSPDRGSQLTAKIDNLDSERDALLAGLRAVIKAYSQYHYLPQKKESAQILKSDIDKYGKKLILKRYQEETAIISAIIQDFTKEDAQHLAEVGLGDWVKQLERSNAEFDRLYIERTKALSTEQKGLVAQLRADSVVQFREMIKVFDAFLILAQVQNGKNLKLLTELDQQISQLSEQYNEALNRANGKKEEEGKSEAETESQEAN